MNLPTMLAAARRLRDEQPEKDRPGAGYEFLLPVARTLEASFLRELIEALPAETGQAPSLQESGRAGDVHTGNGHAGDMHSESGDAGKVRARGGRLGKVNLVPEALPALYHSRAAIVASGTATVEAALMGTPFVMVYRVSRLTYALGKPRVKVPYFAMVNLIAGEEVVPELVQDKFTAENIVAELNKIIPEGEARARMIERLAAVKGRLKLGSGEAGQHPSERAAEIILQMAGLKMDGRD